MSRTVVSVAVESLEPRLVRTAVYPTAYEQYAVELINRARANPLAEAARYTDYKNSQGDTYNGDLNEGLSADTISSAAKQPVAINPYLVDSARKHSQWMTDHSTFSHYEGSTDPGQREVAAGYTDANSWGENIAANYQSNAFGNYTNVVDSQHRDLFTDQTESDRGHRTNMMNAGRNEIGIGLVAGKWNYPNYGRINSFVYTHDSASDGKIFLTGVSYADVVTKDNFYTPGEGLAGVTLQATRQSDGKVFTTTTWNSGGYSMAIEAGTYDVKAFGGALTVPVYRNAVVVTNQNVKVDAVAGATEALPPSAIFGAINNKKLFITGTSGADTISAQLFKGKYVVTMNGTTLSWSASRAKTIEIFAGAGNDTINLGGGIARSYVQGDAGNDKIIGNEFANGLYGNTGNDTINGAGGDDLLFGGDGADLIYGGDGNDRVYAEAGNDTVDAGSGNDRVYGGTGDDLLAGGVGRDVLYGEAGSDTLSGGRGSDFGDRDSADSLFSIETVG